jgi:hypothetical protein
VLRPTRRRWTHTTEPSLPLRLLRSRHK